VIFSNISYEWFGRRSPVIYRVELVWYIELPYGGFSSVFVIWLFYLLTFWVLLGVWEIWFLMLVFGYLSLPVATHFLCIYAYSQRVCIYSALYSCYLRNVHEFRCCSCKILKFCWLISGFLSLRFYAFQLFYLNISM